MTQAPMARGDPILAGCLAIPLFVLLFGPFIWWVTHPVDAATLDAACGYMNTALQNIYGCTYSLFPNAVIAMQGGGAVVATGIVLIWTRRENRRLARESKGLSR